MSRLEREVASLITEVVRGEALSRFRHLDPADVATKDGGEVVTAADRVVERELAVGLARLVPGSVVVGEESVAASPALLRALDGERPVWLVDPIDGTREYVRGRTGFSTMVALCAGGRTVAAWVYAPLAGMMMTARAGAGTRINGARVRIGPAEEPVGMCVIVTDPVFQTPTDRVGARRLRRAGLRTVPAGSVGVAYVRLVGGHAGAAVFGWEKPWDHAAGLLAYAEAGGFHAGRDGACFRVGGGNALPFAVAPDRRLVDRLHRILEGGGANSAATVPGAGDRGNAEPGLIGERDELRAVPHVQLST